MATNTLVNRSSGQTITEDFFNDFNSALQGDVVGRNASGVPEAGQSLGTAAFPWGTLRAAGLVINGNSIDVSAVSAPPYRIQSGKTRATSNQPAFIEPNGASNEFTISAASDSLTYDVNASTITLSSDIVVGSLSVAPSTNNTCLVDDTDATGQGATRLWGEEGGRHWNTELLPTTSKITVDAMGSELTSLIGTVQAFEVNGEYFIGKIESATEISECFRGFFYDSSSLPSNRQVLTDNDTITLLKIGYVFLDSDAVTADVTYTAPEYSFSAPSAPATGDYWYDLGNNLWKRYDGATFNTVSRTIVGMIVMDDTNCIAARCVDFDARYKENEEIDLILDSTSIVTTSGIMQKTNVAGNDIEYMTSKPQWNITTDLAPNADMYSATEQADTRYYMYVTDEGDTVISDIQPYRRRDMLGFYHPHNPWKCVGTAYNDSGSDLNLPNNKSSFEYIDIINVTTPTITLAGTEMSNISNLRVQGVRVDNTYILSMAFQFDLATGNNLDCVNFDIKSDLDFLKGKNVIGIMGSVQTNVNSSGAGGALVSGYVGPQLNNDGEMQVCLIGAPFLAQTNRLAYGTVHIKVSDY